jgi:hypothetical protein
MLYHANFRKLIFSILIISAFILVVGCGDSDDNHVSLTIISIFDTQGEAYDVSVSGNYAYVTVKSASVQVIDISDPHSPTLAGTCYTSGPVGNISVYGSYAYVTVEGVGIQIIDISDPESPFIAGEFETLEPAQDIHVSVNYAYITAGNSEFQIVDISDPENPFLTGSFTTGGGYDLFVSGDYAYIPKGWDGFIRVDISDPTNPVGGIAGHTEYGIYDVFVSGNHAYFTAGIYGILYVFDISNPERLPNVCDWGASVRVGDIFVSGKYAYVNTYDGLGAIDISDPTDPSLAGWCDLSGDKTRNIHVSGNLVYVPSGDTGLIVVKSSD